MTATPITPPFALELAAGTTHAVNVVSSSQIVRIGVEGTQHYVPVKLARLESILPMGGETLWPGSEMDFQGPFFLLTPGASPGQGPKPFVWCENRTMATNKCIDPMGQLHAQAIWKPGYRDLVPGVWAKIMTSVQGQNGVRLRASGGTAFVGTHIDITVPPLDPDPIQSAIATPLYEGDPWMTIRGNPNLYAYAYNPGVRLWYIREQCAWF